MYVHLVTIPVKVAKADVKAVKVVVQATVVQQTVELPTVELDNAISQVVQPVMMFLLVFVLTLVVMAATSRCITVSFS